MLLVFKSLVWVSGDVKPLVNLMEDVIGNKEEGWVGGFTCRGGGVWRVLYCTSMRETQYETIPINSALPPLLMYGTGTPTHSFIHSLL